MVELENIQYTNDMTVSASDSNNYRPIALATIMPKLFKSAILLKCEMFLDTCTCLNQFGFKKGHNTDMCIFVLKEFIEFYRSQNTSVFVTFLDVSKAYDKLIIGSFLTLYNPGGGLLKPPPYEFCPHALNFGSTLLCVGDFS